jgi:predicted nucleic acid-binding protein
VIGHAAQYAHEHRALSFTSVTVYEIAPLPEDYLAAASIRAKATRQGTLLELTDCLIAAVAVRLGRVLVTGNTDDFRAIQKTGVKLVIDNWRESLH